jgi:hypothetical protein
MIQPGLAALSELLALHDHTISHTSPAESGAISAHSYIAIFVATL